MVHLLEVTPVSLGYLTLGGFVVLFSSVSLLIKEKLYMGEVVLGTAFGIIIGPHGANIFSPRSWGDTPEHQNRITLEVMRVVLATGLFAIGVELPRAYMARHARSLLTLVVPTMAFGWLVSAGLIIALFPKFTFVSALAISACLTPTDPILAAAIIGGNFATKNVPHHIRHLISAESASNDGLAYPFISISLYLALESSKKVAFEKWILIGWLYQVIFGTFLGAVLGIAFSYLMRISHKKGLIDRESFVAQYLAISFFVIGIASTIGTDDLLAAFAAGVAISWDGHFNAQTENEIFSSVIDLVLNCACFVYIGAWLPFESYYSPDLGIFPWRLVLLFLAILVLRRIPVLLILYPSIPDIHDWREALFCGHFGPMGVGAIFISCLALKELPSPTIPPHSQNELLSDTLQTIVSFIVLCSIFIHGLSIPIYWFGRKFHRTMSLRMTWSQSFSKIPGDSSAVTTQPDWLLSTQRGRAATQSPVSPSKSREFVSNVSVTQTSADLESGMNPMSSAVLVGNDTENLPAKGILTSGGKEALPGTPRFVIRAKSPEEPTDRRDERNPYKLPDNGTGLENRMAIDTRTDFSVDVVYQNEAEGDAGNDVQISDRKGKTVVTSWQGDNSPKENVGDALEARLHVESGTERVQ